MSMTDAEGDVTFVNEGWRRFTGGTETAGVTFASSAHPDDREATVRLWTEAMSRREEFRCEYRLRHAASGGYRWVLELGTPRYSGGEFVGYVGTATDIHERRTMEEALRASETIWRELADTAPAMMWTTDPDGAITFVNQGWLRFTGTTFHEEMGESWALGVHPEDAEPMLAELGGGARRPPRVGGRVPPEASRRRVPLDPRPRRAAHRRRPLRGVCRHGDRRPRAEDDGGAPARGVRARAPDRRDPPAGPAARAAAADRGRRARRPLPARRARRRHRRRLVRRARAPDGRVALVVGDVAGHGLRAAASMGQLRNAFRAYGMVEASPAEVVARINRLVMSGVEQVMATVLYLVLDRETGEVAWSAAGHPPPLVIAPDGARFLEGGRSVPIGAADPAVFREATAILPPGSSLLLYTDGLVERRDTPLDERLKELAEAAAAAGDELGELCEHVIAKVLGPGDPSDDVAILAVRPLPVADTEISLTLPAEPGSLAQLRRRLARFLHVTGATELEQYEITLTICEAAGNAIEHAYGPGDATYEVDVSFEDGELTAVVRDSGSWRDKRGEHRGRGLAIIEDLMDDVAVERADGGTLVRMRRRVGEDRAA